MKLRGMLDPTSPHNSVGQLARFAECPKGWAEEYGSGRRRRPTWRMRAGSAGHAMAATMAAIRKETGSLDSADVDRAVKKHQEDLVGDYGLFRSVSNALRRHGQRLNDEEVLEVEQDYTIELRASGLTVLWKARIDVVVLDVETDYRDIRDYKLERVVTSSADLADDFQTSIYGSLYRHKHGWTAPMWKSQTSLVRGITYRSEIDADDARLATEYAVEATKKMLDCIRLGSFDANVCRSCPDCPGAAKCRTWIPFLRRRGESAQVTTLGTFASLRERSSTVTGVKDEIGEIVRARVEAAGGVLEEGGFRGELVPREGGLPDEYQGFTTVEEFRKALTRDSRESLIIKKTKLTGRGK